MKLRTKILWISCLAVLVATLISGGMILGMTAENLKNEAVLKAYQDFYMIDKSRSRKSGGAGLGLALTAVILKQHNISLKIESQVGEGTRMILQFV